MLSSLTKVNSQEESHHNLIQKLLLSYFPDEKTEFVFEKISRRTDFFHTKWQIAFEIQFSPISTQELKSRSLDYSSIKIPVIWIFSARFDTLKNRFLFNRLHLHYYFVQINTPNSFFFYDHPLNFPPKKLSFSSSVSLKTVASPLPPLLPSFSAKVKTGRIFKGEYLEKALQSPAFLKIISKPLDKKSRFPLFYLKKSFKLFLKRFCL